jgi:hypothetical protein
MPSQPGTAYRCADRFGSADPGDHYRLHGARTRTADLPAAIGGCSPPSRAQASLIDATQRSAAHSTASRADASVEELRQRKSRATRRSPRRARNRRFAARLRIHRVETQRRDDGISRLATLRQQRDRANA